MRNRLMRSQFGLGATVLAAACAYGQTSPTYPLLKDCASRSETVASLKASDVVRIRFSFGGEIGTCYAVSAEIGGKTVDGYLVGNAHPAVSRFEQDVQQHAREVAAAPPPAPAPAPPPSQDAKPEPPLPLGFAGFHAIGVNGERIDLGSRRAANVVLYFWSAWNRGSIKTAEPMERIYDEYHPLGVDVVGVASAPNAAQLIQVCRDNEFVWPQVLDSGGIASRYQVDPSRPYLLLDSSRNVITAVSSPLALEAVLGELTKNRRRR